MKMRIKSEDINYITINYTRLQEEFYSSQGNSYYRRSPDKELMDQPIVHIVPYNSSRHGGYYRSALYGSHVTFITNDELQRENDMKSFYEKLKNIEVNIKPEDSIYFSKASAYPRHRLSNYTENKRTIKKENADWIVIPNDGYSFDEKEEIFYRDKNTGKIYQIEDGTSHNYIYGPTLTYLYNHYANFVYDKNKPSREDFIKCYIEKNMNFDFEEISFCRFIINGNYWGKEDFIDLYDNFGDKIITERQLDKYINSKDTTITLDEDKFEMINNLLKSKDQTSVSLGLRTISAIDSDTSFIPLALLILFNIHNITYNKEWNTVGMKVLRERLTFINRYNVNGVKSQINILNQLTKEFVKTDEDRETIRKYGMPMIKQVVDNFIQSELQGVQFINKYNIILE